MGLFLLILTDVIYNKYFIIKKQVQNLLLDYININMFSLKTKFLKCYVNPQITNI